MKSQPFHLKHLFLIAMVSAFPVCVRAQLFQVKSAVKQNWAAGFSYRHGTDYALQLRVTQPKARITFDSLWLDGLLYILPSQHGTEMAIQKDDSGQTISIEASFVWAGPGYMTNDREGATNSPSPSRTLPDTDAVIFYRRQGVPHRFSVGRIEELMMVAFP